MSRTHDLFSEWPWNEVLGTTTPGFSLICMIFFLSFYKLLFWKFHIRKSYRHEESHERRTWSLKESDREGSCWDKNRGREGRLALWAHLLVLYRCWSPSRATWERGFLVSGQDGCPRPHRLKLRSGPNWRRASSTDSVGTGSPGRLIFPVSPPKTSSLAAAPRELL